MTSEQDVLPSEAESAGKEEEKEVQEEEESEDDKVEMLDVVAPSKTKKKKSKETTEVSKGTVASTEVAKMRTKYPVEKRGKRKQT